MNIYNSFIPTWLYIKRHKLTGLLYFGKTIKDPYVYLGSGVIWTRHIKKHGKDQVETVWAKLFTEKDKLVKFARRFSVTANIVESTKWANLCFEHGTDGGHRQNNYLIQVWNKLPRSEEVCLAISKGNTGRAKKPKSQESKIKASNTLQGKTSIFPCYVYNIRYNSIIEACKNLGLTRYQFKKLENQGLAFRSTG